MFGIYFNLSFWYKLIDRTIWGAYFAGIGAFILIAIDVIFIPRFSYWACAWAGFTSFAVSIALSYFFERKYYPINYPLKDIALYLVIAIVLFAGISLANSKLPMAAALAVNTIIIILYAVLIIKRDFPLNRLMKKFKH
jgi:O-antigen/teichoic acid export membrane protein